MRCTSVYGLPGWVSGKESACQCRRCGFNPWVGKILWRRKWQPIPVFWEIPWTEEPGGLQSMESQRTLTMKPPLPPPDFLIALTVQNLKISSKASLPFLLFFKMGILVHLSFQVTFRIIYWGLFFKKNS